MMNRAYSLLTIKNVDSVKREIEGIATTPTPDRMGDVIEPLGVKYKNPLPLLLYHDSERPVGLVKFDKPTEDGITFKASLPEITQSGSLKDRVEEAWQSIAAGLIRGVSIGFRRFADAIEPLKSGGVRFLKSEVLELSLVTVPAQSEATITSIKSIDALVRAAIGKKLELDVPNPGASGVVLNLKHAREGKTVKTIKQQISDFEAARAAKSARMGAIMEKAAEDGSTLDDAESTEYDELEAEIKKIDGHLARLHNYEKQMAKAATAVEKIEDTKSGSEARSSGTITVKRQIPPGIPLARYVQALAHAKGNLMQAAEIAKAWWKDSTPEVELALRAAVTAGTVIDSDWAAPLVPFNSIAGEFVALLYPSTIIGRIPNLRRVPFNVKMPTQTQGATANWVGEGMPKPVSELKFGTITLGMAKASGIVILSEELVKVSSPSAEAIVKQDLIDTITKFLDRQFIDPAVAPVPNVSPASITNAVTGIPASGTGQAALKTDLANLIGQFTGNNQSLSGAVFVMQEKMAQLIGMMENPLGQPTFSGMTLNGGTLYNVPVVASENVPVGLIVLAKAPEIYLADDGGVMLDVSREASVQMDSAPMVPDATTVTVSLWQMNMVGIRAERFINWQKRRATAVSMITGAAYTGA